MTMQSQDSVIFKGKRYNLVDIEKDKSIIRSAQFVIPVLPDYLADPTAYITSCWKGYYIDLEIINDRLYGTRKIMGYNFQTHDLKFFLSARTPLNFSGAILISDCSYTEYRKDILYGTETIELLFDRGNLDQIYEHPEIYRKYQEIQATQLITEPMEERAFVDSFLRYSYHTIDSYKMIHEKDLPGFMPNIIISNECNVLPC